MEVVTVDLDDRSYDIVIGRGVLSVAGKFIKAAVDSLHFVIVTDSNIPQEYSDLLCSSISGEISRARVDIIRIEPGEASKSYSGIEGLLDKIFETRLDRRTTLIALGGGVVGDLTGFAASILLRGVNFIQVPTTLLAQVDSSVGGKTGINNKFGKNLVGSFYQPKIVLIDIATLDSLPKREFLAGYAEVVKYGLINDEPFFKWLDDNLGSVMNKDEAAIKKIVMHSCNAKADIVAQDEREGGVRALLNLGHTFGHVLEQQLGYDGTIIHGEAVAVGMVFAFELSMDMGLCKDSDVERVKDHLLRFGLPVSPCKMRDKWDADEMLKVMYNDKKVSDGKLVFILAKSIGESFIQKDIDGEIIRDTIGRVTDG